MFASKIGMCGEPSDTDRLQPLTAILGNAATAGQEGAAKCLLPGLTTKLTCRGRLQVRCLLENQYGSPGQVQRLVRQRIIQAVDR